MSTIQPQAVAGVSATRESEVMTVYPSIGSTGLGRLLGQLYDSIPVPVGSTTLSRLLFPLPTAPLGAMLYFFLKATGNKYRLTNRSIQIWSSLGARMIQQVALTDVSSVDVEQQSGQAFFRSADLVIRDNAGKVVMRLAGIPHAGVFRETVLKAHAARNQVQAALSTLNAR